MIPCAHCHFYADNMDQLVIHMKLIHKTERAYWLSRTDTGKLYIQSEINPNPEQVPFRLEQLNLDAVIDVTETPGKIVYLKQKPPGEMQETHETQDQASTSN